MIIGLTGARGTVGKHLVKLLEASSPDAIVVPFQGDITARDAVADYLERLGKCSALVHLAAKVSVDATASHPETAYETNVSGTINLLSHASRLPSRPYFFYCSTSHVYAPSDQPLREDDPTGPASVYGRTKLIGELATTDICTAHSIPFCIGRVFSLFDPDQVGDYLYPVAKRRLAALQANAPLTLRGADSVRDFLPASAVASIIAQLVQLRVEGVINVASGNPQRVRDFVRRLATTDVTIVHEGASNSIIADITRLAMATGKVHVG